MVSDLEAKALGPVVLGVGLAVFTAGLLKLLGWADDRIISALMMACPVPLILAYGTFFAVWVVREWPRRPVAEPQKQAATATTVPPQVPTAAEQLAAVRAHHWRVMTHRFVAAGDQWGFGVRILAGKDPERKVISWGGWGEMTKVLRNAGVLAGAGDGTKWADDWSFPRWNDERHRLALPHPDSDPPEVAVFIRHTTTQQPATGGAWTVMDGK